MLTLTFHISIKCWIISDGSGDSVKTLRILQIFFYMSKTKAEWHFFATSHRKQAFDGVGGIIKRLATHASLQRPISNQILTTLQLFEFSNVEIHGVTSFLISTEHVDQVAQFLQSRFSNSCW